MAMLGVTIYFDQTKKSVEPLRLFGFNDHQTYPKIYIRFNTTKTLNALAFRAFLSPLLLLHYKIESLGFCPVVYKEGRLCSPVVLNSG